MLGALSYINVSTLSSGDSTARLWRLREDRSHDPPIVLPHEPVGSSSQKCNRDVTTVHWNVSVHVCVCFNMHSRR